MKKEQGECCQTEERQDKPMPIAIRINITTDNRSISHSEWLKFNDTYKELGIVFEISDKGYLSMVMTQYNLTHIDIASWVAIGMKSIEEEVQRRLSICQKLHIYAHTPLQSMDNVIDLYITKKSRHYYLDSQCSNAALLLLHASPFPIPELRDTILKSFKGSTQCYTTMLLIDCGTESHDTAIGRIKRMAALCLFQMGIPASKHLIDDVYISYIDNNDNDSLRAMGYIYMF